MKTVPLYGELARGRVALVDDEDYDFVMQYRWSLWEYKRVGRTSGPYAMKYIKRNGVDTTIRMHQMLTGWPVTDHIDHNGLNNQRSNLRSATILQNNIHSRPPAGGSSPYKGVWWHAQSRRWTAKITIDRRKIGLGHYRDEIDAAHAYDAAARAMFGEFAYLNFPEDNWAPIRSVRITHPEIDDAVIAALRAEGLTWKELGAAIGMTPSGARQRWLKIQHGHWITKRRPAA